MPLLETDSEIQSLLKETKRIAVFGITKDPKKPSNYVPLALKERGFEIFGVNPKYSGETTGGIKIYSSLSEIPYEVDAILVFRRPTDLPEVAEEAYKKGFKTFWMQPGTVNENVKDELIKKGYNVVAGKCMKIETERLLKKVYGG